MWNVTAVDNRASRTINVESRCGPVLDRLVHSPRRRPDHPQNYVVEIVLPPLFGAMYLLLM